MWSSNSLALLALFLSTLTSFAGGQSVAAGSWEPLALLTKAGIVAAYDFGRTNTVTLNGAGISQITDRTRLGHHLTNATAASQPTYTNTGPNGTWSAYFDGSNDYLKASAFTLSQPTEVYWLGKQVSWTSFDFLLDGNGANSLGIVQHTSTPNIDVFAGTHITDNTNLVVGAFGVLKAIFNGGSSSLQVNNTTATTGNSGAANAGGVTMASIGTFNGNFANAQVARTLICNKTNAPAESGYLSWGLKKAAGVL